MEESKHLEAFLSFLHNAKVEHQAAIEEETLTELETQDILHRLELYSDSYRERAKLANSLKLVRQRRRVAKDTYEVTKSIVRWAEDNKQVIRSLEWLLGEVRKVEDRQEKRIYIPKTDILDEVLKHES